MEFQANGFETAWLKVAGITSLQDAARVCAALQAIHGIARVSASPRPDSVRVEYDAGVVRPWQFRAAVRAASCRVESITLPGDPAAVAPSALRPPAAA
jgi:copper chaperone CopZ